MIIYIILYTCECNISYDAGQRTTAEGRGLSQKSKILITKKLFMNNFLYISLLFTDKQTNKKRIKFSKLLSMCLRIKVSISSWVKLILQIYNLYEWIFKMDITKEFHWNSTCKLKLCLKLCKHLIHVFRIPVTIWIKPKYSGSFVNFTMISQVI